MLKDKTSSKKETLREWKYYSGGLMVSVGVSRMKKTSVLIVEPGAKVNSEYYYCEHFLRWGFLPVIQATCGHHNWTLDDDYYYQVTSSACLNWRERKKRAAFLDYCIILLIILFTIIIIAVV